MPFLTGFKRRKSITVNGTTQGAQTNYQMRIKVNKGVGTDSPGNIFLGPNVNNNFSDIRFTSSDELTLLDYWIESFTLANNAIIWIKIPIIPISPGSSFIYIYYDNVTATTTSNGVTTFLSYTDKNNLSDWSQTFYGNPDIWAASGDYIRFNSSAGNPYRDKYKPVSFVNTKYAVEWKNFYIANGYAGVFAVLVDRVGEGSDRRIAYNSLKTYGQGLKYLESGILFELTPMNLNTIYSLRVEIDEDNRRINYYFFDSNENLIANALNKNNGLNAWAHVARLGIGDFVSSGGNPFDIVDLYIKQIIVRNFSSPEPTFGTIGNEETSGIVGPFCPSTTRSSGDSITMNAAPQNGIGPYTVRFFKKIGSFNIIQIGLTQFNISEASSPTSPTTTPQTYIITDDDIVNSTGDPIATPPLAVGSIRFLVQITDSCPTGGLTCQEICDIQIACVAPTCNMVIT